jgi:soluble lytic murein transglycosylase-like protein
MADIDAEIASVQAEIERLRSLPEPVMTPAPVAPAPGQLMSLAEQPTRPPTTLELGVAELRTRSPLEQAIADAYGRKLLTQEAYSLGTFPKIEAAAEAGKALLFGRSPVEQFAQETQRQDILKEYVKQKDLEANQLLLGMTGPELGGALLSPVGRLYTPGKVAAGAGLTSALATRAANIAKAGGTAAGAAGLQTFLSQPGTVEERLAKAGQVAGPAAAIGGGLAGLGEAVSAAGPKLIELGKSGRRAAIGARLGDYNKGVGKRQIDIDPTTGARSLTEKGLDNVIEKGYLGENLNPRIQSVNLESNIGQLESQLDDLISGVEAQGVKTPSPSFKNIKDKIKAGKGYTVRDQDKYLAEIADIEAKLNQRGEGKLSYLQEQKKAFGATYDPKGNGADAMFNRDIYHALQDEIEKYVPQARQLNQEVQGLLLTRPIVARGVSEESNKFLALANRISKAGFTTGGIFGAGATGLLGPVGGLAVGTLGAALTSKPVQDVVAQGLTRPQDIARALGRLGSQAGAAQRPEIQAMFPEATEATAEASDVDKQIESLRAEIEALKAVPSTPSMPAQAPKGASKQSTNTDVDLALNNAASKHGIDVGELRAIAQVESSFNPKAVGPKTRYGQAQGLMQLIPATAKALGVKNAFDPEQSADGAGKLLTELESSFGKYNDRRFIWAAYNSRPQLIKNAIAKVKANDESITWSNVSRYVPSETKSYVKKISQLIS